MGTTSAHGGGPAGKSKQSAERELFVDGYHPDYKLARETKDPDVLRRLAGHHDIFVKIAVVESEHAPEDVLVDRFLHDSESIISGGAGKNPHMPSDVLGVSPVFDDLYGYKEGCVASNPSTPLSRLVKSAEYAFRIEQDESKMTAHHIIELLARNPSSADEVFKIIISMKSASAKMVLLNREDCPEWVKTKLKDDKDDKVARLARLKLGLMDQEPSPPGPVDNAKAILDLRHDVANLGERLARLESQAGTAPATSRTRTSASAEAGP